ncbi:MAG: hypothetical protein EG822_05230 [Deltaproteobacteria bacterium]|nr:hypothetical protein [Deltaproteobacteria bacterium]TLN04401.1 MAG: hypothetical protein FDZ73_03710 [bacterium]
MKTLICTVIILFLCAVSADISSAQEISALGGFVKNTDRVNRSYQWQLDYRQALGEHLDFNVTYLNEAHLPDHHRDGFGSQLWLRTAILDRRLALAAGVGPYYFFDTTPNPAGSGNLNDQGWGALISLAATWYTASPWLVQLRGNWVETGGGIDTISLLVGVGYQLDPSPSAEPDRQASSRSLATAQNEITAFIGETSVFNSDSPHSLAAGLEYRRALLRYVEGTVSWLYEGSNHGSQMNGLATQLWAAKSFFADRLALSFGAGPYIGYDRLHDNTLIISGVATMSVAYRFHPRWGTRASWNRIITDYDRDADVWLAGISYRF